MSIELVWDRHHAPEELHSILATLSEDYPIGETGAGLAVRFEATAEPGCCRVERTEERAIVRYASPAMAMRAVSALLSGLVEPGAARQERSPFTLFGIMLDCSRNAVMRVDHLKTWLRRLALLGYNAALLYTEDTYELPDEPYFGYLRGAYTADELREIDAYAGRLGIEIIPCIQTLGHLAQILKWPAYDKVRDTGSVLLVDQQETYGLIAKMLDFWGSICRTRRVHIGMDETHDLGRGRFLDQHGYENGFSIFNRHLGRVVELCRERGLAPMIWSDMYFRLGSKTGDYYDRECVIPQEVIEQIPQEAQLVYWDYYHADKAFYLDWIERHRRLGSEPVMGSGVWTWSKFWHDRNLTEDNAGACIEACRETGVSEIFFTMWGDDGGYCEFDSAFAGLAYAAEKAFAGEVEENALEKRFSAVCAADYQLVSQASALNQLLQPTAVLWDDPLLAIYLQHTRAKEGNSLAQAEQDYLNLAQQLEPHEGEAGAGRIAHLRLLSRTLGLKVGLAERLIEAYGRQDREALRRVAAQIPALEALLRQVSDSWRAGWLARNKPFGLEVLQIRLGGQLERYRELACRLEEYLSGTIATIPELDANLPQAPGGSPGRSSYRGLASASNIL